MCSCCFLNCVLVMTMRSVPAHAFSQAPLPELAVSAVFAKELKQLDSDSKDASETSVAEDDDAESYAIALAIFVGTTVVIT